MPLRPLTPDDAAACAAIAEAYRWKPHDEAWRIALTLGEGIGIDAPEGGLAAAAIRVGHGGGAGVLSVMVGPRHARGGLGRRVVEALLAGAPPGPVEVHAPPAGVPFALRLGFTPAGAAVRWAGRPIPGRRREAGAALRPVGGQDFPAVVAVDEVAFGARRRPLLEALFPLARRACLAVTGGRTVGYGLAWNDGDQLAVGPIVAEEDAIAAAMLAWLVGGGDAEVRVDVPVERLTSADVASALGLAPVGRITRLVRGGGAAGRRERLHALAAPWAG